MKKRANVVSVRTLLCGDIRFRTAQASRGYVWGAPEIAQLLIDLEESARDFTPDDTETPERLYLGVVTIAQSRSQVATLIDGVQRLAAIVMFLSFARDRTTDPALIRRIDRALVRRPWFGPASPRLELAEKDQRWFAAHILEPHATLRLPHEAPPGGPSRMLASARFMYRAFAAYSPDDFWRLCDFLLDHTAVVLAEAGDGSAALIDFVSHRQRLHADSQSLTAQSPAG